MPKIQDKMRFKAILGLKISVILMGLAFLFWSLQSSNLSLLSDYWSQEPKTIISAVFILIVFSVLNWFGEVKKWCYLVGHISVYKATRQTLVSHSLSIFTPNKWGEYGGKCLFYPKHLSPQIIAMTGLGHLCQLITTLVFGVFGLWMSTQKIKELNVIQVQWSWMMLLPLLVIIFALCFKTIRHKIKLVFQSLVKTESSKIKIALFWSAFRYVVFAHQFLFLLWHFGAEIGYVDGIGLIGVVYLLSSLIPVFAIADVVVKGSIGITLMSFAGLSISQVLLAVFIMWLGNTMVPALLGYFWIWSWKPVFAK